MTNTFLCIAALLVTAQLGTVHAFRKKQTGRESMTVDAKMIAGVPVYNYHLAHLARSKLRDQGKALLEMKLEQVANVSTTHWIVMLKPGSTDTQVHRFCEEGYRCLFEGSSDGLPFVDLEATESDLEKLLGKHAGEVDFVEPDLPTFVIPSEPAELGDDDVSIQAKTWGLNRISSSVRRRSGAGANIYIVDTGIRFSHEQFRGHAKPAIETGYGKLVECGTKTSCAYDRNGHGTHCAGTAGGKNYGVAPGATIWSVKTQKDDGSGSSSTMVSAFDWMVRKAKKPAVASVSLGGGGTSTSIKTAINKMVSAGITVVVAAGNDGGDACNHYPSFVSSAITVGSSDKNNRRSIFSRGSSNYGSCVNIFAPGSDIFSAKHSSNTATTSMSGTSMACPHVAGAVALILASNKDLKPSAVLSKLRNAAKKGIIQDSKGSANYLLQVGSF